MRLNTVTKKVVWFLAYEGYKLTKDQRVLLLILAVSLDSKMLFQSPESLEHEGCDISFVARLLTGDHWRMHNKLNREAQSLIDLGYVVRTEQDYYTISPELAS